MRDEQELIQNITAWKVIDATGASPEAYTDAQGFWRLPQTSPETLEAPFETDRQELERLGTMKANLGLWPGEGVAHFYQPAALILGKLDRRLPAVDTALQWAEDEAIPLVLRIAGGQAIVSDNGVLNISLLTAMPDETISIAQGFELMAQVVQGAFTRVVENRYGEALPELHAHIGAVPRSYCPGDYDLAVGGKKICGIAQRRVKNAIGLMGYVSVGGDQAARARLVREYYRQGEANERFPASDPEVMTTVNDALRAYDPWAVPVTVEEFRDHVLAEIGAEQVSRESIMNENIV